MQTDFVPVFPQLQEDEQKDTKTLPLNSFVVQIQLYIKPKSRDGE